MPHFGTRSLERLETVDPDLVAIFTELIRLVDVSILCGSRSEADQNAAVASGNSRTPWPQSRHNCPEPGQLSRAVDWAPYPIDWNAADRFLLCGGLLWGIAEGLEVEVRLGSDWSRNGRANGNGFEDLGHVELWEP